MSYMSRRLLALPIMIIGVTIITFMITYFIPADPARVAAGLNAPEALVEQLRVEMGLNDPVWQQYFRYMGNLVQGDLGRSMLTRRPVAEELRVYLPATLELIILAAVMFFTVGIIFGVYAGSSSKRYNILVLKLVSYMGMAIPAFWLGLVLQIVFARNIDWLPFGGRLPSGFDPPPTISGFYTVDSLLAGDIGLFFTSLKHLFLPALTLALGRFAATARFVASGMRRTLSEDYIRTARAKGLHRKQVILKHALKNALIPVLTMSGLQFGWMLGNTILVEAIFSWPGIGRFAWRSIVSLDFLPIMGVTLFFAITFIVINVVIDLVYGLIDPRIKL